MRLYIQTYKTILFSLCAAFAACSDELLDAPNFDAGKSPIELKVGGVDAPAQTRAVITDGTGKTLRAFTGQTRLFFALVADDGSGNKKYGFNYGTAAAVNDPVVDSKSSITFPDNYLYWDDAYGRESKVSVYSIAVANKVRGKVELTENGSIAIGTENPGKAIIPFTTTNPGTPTFIWQIGNSDGGSAYKQDQEVFEWADLVFSNNIANYDTDPSNPNSSKDKRLIFHTEAGEKYHKFDNGELIYYHALTQFTIKIKCGAGFKGDGTDFKFTDAIGVACTTPNNSFGLNGFYGANGVFYIGNGEFATMTDANKRNYTSIYKVSENHRKASEGEYYLMKAYVFPGTDMTGTKADAFSFIVDGNKYDVSLAKLYEALNSGTTGGNANVISDILTESKYLKAGYNYEFTFTVGKTAVNNITARVVDWETVKASDYSPTNARITIDVEDNRGTEGETPIMLYRAHNDADVITDDWEHYEWEKGYNDNVTLTYNSETHKYAMLEGTEWYWENNMTYYHFRTVQPSTMTVYPTENKSSEDNYITLTSSATGITEANDVKWGAPFKDLAEEPKVKFKYDFSKGFDVNMGDENPHQIYKAIGPTLAKITIIPFHMMSDVTIKLKTVEGAKAVTLEGATVKLVNAYAAGKVLMGNGKVIGTGSLTTEDAENSSITYNSKADGKYIYKYGAVPQDLADVSLVIQTSDHNRYIVPMASIFTKTEPSTNNIDNPYKPKDGKYYLDKWYPGFMYEYELELSKTGINNFRATIVNWETVTAEDETVQIK